MKNGIQICVRSLQAPDSSNLIRGLLITQVQLDNFELRRPVEDRNRDETFGQNAYSAEGEAGDKREQQQEPGEGENRHHHHADIVLASWNVLIPSDISGVGN